MPAHHRDRPTKADMKSDPRVKYRTCLCPKHMGQKGSEFLTWNAAERFQPRCRKKLEANPIREPQRTQMSRQEKRELRSRGVI